MIRYLSEKVATYIAKDDDSTDIELLVYGYELIFQEIGVLVAASIIAIPFGLFFQVIMSFCVYNLLRVFSGGTHAEHRYACVITSVVLVFGPSAFFTYSAYKFTPVVMLALYAVGFLLLFMYAPADTEMKPIRNPQTIKKMKLQSLIILTLIDFMAFIFYRWRPDFSSIIITMSTIVCIFTHPLLYKLYGCRKSAIIE